MSNKIDRAVFSAGFVLFHISNALRRVGDWKPLGDPGEDFYASLHWLGEERAARRNHLLHAGACVFRRLERVQHEAGEQ